MYALHIKKKFTLTSYVRLSLWICTTSPAPMHLYMRIHLKYSSIYEQSNPILNAAKNRSDTCDVLALHYDHCILNLSVLLSRIKRQHRTNKFKPNSLL